MDDLLYYTLHHFAASGNGIAAAPGNEPACSASQPNVMISLKPSNGAESVFASEGYTNTRVFSALPSRSSPRWLIPLGERRCTLEGLQIYKPYKRRARVLKGLLSTLVAARFQGFATHHVVVASRGPLPLETLVHDVTGESQPFFSLLVGTEARFRKLTIQVMRADGEILGYIKLPLTEAAVEHVRHEADTLNKLWGFSALRSRIPRVLYSGEWGEGTILFQSAGPSRPGPSRFSNQCEEFLQLLREVHPTKRPGHHLWEQVAARWHRTEPKLTPGWGALGRAVINKAKRELEAVMVPYSVSHGDFAPWNTRVGDGRLYVFDWEWASWEAPASWDSFHFKTQVASLLKRNTDPQASLDLGSGERASFLLYLLNSACHLFGEESPTRGAGLEFRRRLLAKQLGGR